MNKFNSKINSAENAMLTVGPEAKKEARRSYYALTEGNLPL